ncbi:MAG: tetratricopeptide repeat protein [Thermoplasmata archaeon]
MTEPRVEPGDLRWEEGNLLFGQGRYPDAVWAYTDAIRRDPKQARYYHNRAVARAALADATGAREDAWRVIELDPDSDSTRRLVSLLDLFASRPEAPGRTEGPPPEEMPPIPPEMLKLTLRTD